MRRTSIIICSLLAGVSALTCRTNVAEAVGRPSNGSTCVTTSVSCFWTNGAEEFYPGVKMNVVYGCDELAICSRLGAGVTVTGGITVNCCSEDECNVRPANLAPNLKCRTNVAEARGLPSIGPTDTCGPNQYCFWTNAARESQIGVDQNVRMNVVYGCDVFEICPQVGMGVTVTDGITVNCCSNDSCNVPPANLAPNLECRTNVAEARGMTSIGSTDTCGPNQNCFWTNKAMESQIGVDLNVGMDVVYGCDVFGICPQVGMGVTVTDGITVNCCSKDSCNVPPANLAPNLKCRTNVAEALGMTSIGPTDTCGPYQNCFWTNKAMESQIGVDLRVRMDEVYGCDEFGICIQVGMGVTVTDGITVNCCSTDSCNTNTATVLYASGLIFLLASFFF